MGPSVDLNADLGEGFGVWRLGDDDALLELVTSANVACGFHAGDPLTMRRVCAAAAARDVAVGAQVGYRDLAGFGRRRIDVAPDELAADVLYQVGALAACARAAGTEVRYVKPHGALYTTAAVDTRQADAVVSAVADVGLPLLGPPGSALSQACEGRGVSFVAEGFADRAYRTDGTLVPRGSPGAVVTDVSSVVERVLRMVRDRTVFAVDGSEVALEVDSVCLHGDTSGAVELARAVRSALTDDGVALVRFA